MVYRVQRREFARTHVSFFEDIAAKVLHDNDLLELADEATTANTVEIRLPIEGEYKSVGLFEWRGHWTPIVLTSPTLSNVAFTLDDIKRSFSRHYNTLFWDGNKDAMLSRTPFLYSAVWYRGRLFLLGVELDPSVFSEGLMDSRRIQFTSIAYAMLGSLLFALIVAFILYLLARFYLKGVLDSIREGLFDMPIPPLPCLDTLARVTVQNAREVAQQRHDKRIAIMEKHNEFENERRDFALVRDIIESTALAPDLESAASAAIEPIVRKMGVRCGTIFSADANGLLHLIGEYNLPADIAHALGKDGDARPLAMDSSEKPRSFAILPIQSLPGFEDSPLFSLKEEGLTHCIFVPLYYRDRIWGAIYLYCSGRPRITDRDKAVVLAAANEIAVILENKRLLGELDERVKENIEYFELSKMLISTSDFDILLENILWVVHESIDADHCNIMLADEEAESLSVKATWGYPKEHQNPRLSFGQGIVGWAAENAQALLVNDVTADDRYLPNLESTKSELAVPLIVDGAVIGVIDCESDMEYSFSETDVRFLTHVAELASLAIERTRIQADLARHFILDPVTQLYNAAYFDDYISKHGKELLLRHGRISIAVIGITNFDEMNSSYGSAATDLIAKQTAEMLDELFPESIVARYTNSEFFVLLPGIGEKAADKLIDSLQKHRERWSSKHADALPLSFTVGYATATRFDELENLISMVDHRVSGSQ